MTMKPVAILATFIFWIAGLLLWLLGDLTLRESLRHTAFIALLLSPFVIGMAILMSYCEGQLDERGRVR
jgi:hypothetical protein